MKIELASSYGFCFGVKRAIKIAENAGDAATIGPLIHNNEEINRLAKNFNVRKKGDHPYARHNQRRSSRAKKK